MKALSQNQHIKKILLLDDDEDECQLFNDALASVASYVEFFCVNDSTELEEKLSMEPDIIFLDINMPKRNGFECLKVIRETMKLNHLPVVVYTNSFHITDIKKAYKSGANLIVNKPCSFQSIKTALSNVVQMDWSNLEEITDQYSSQNKILHFGD